MSNRATRLELDADKTNVEVVVAMVTTEQEELQVVREGGQEGRVGDTDKAAYMTIRVPGDKLDEDFDFNALIIPVDTSDRIKVVNPVDEDKIVQAVERLLGAEKERVIISLLGAKAFKVCRDEIDRIAKDDKLPHRFRAVLVQTVMRRVVSRIGIKD